MESGVSPLERWISRLVPAVSLVGTDVLRSPGCVNKFYSTLSLAIDQITGITPAHFRAPEEIYLRSPSFPTCQLTPIQPYPLHLHNVVGGDI